MALYRGQLHYPPTWVLHTATSGPVPHLDELYLQVSAGEGQCLALGGVRINIAYLTGLDPEALVAEALATVAALDWERWLAGEGMTLPTSGAAPVGALLEQTLGDATARARQVPLAVALGGAFHPTLTTHQTLFWQADLATWLGAAEDHWARGYRCLKVRLGVVDFEEECQRLAILRQRLGDGLALAVDVNGRWPVAGALERLQALADQAVSYVEQPLPARAWEALAALLPRAPLPMVLDEAIMNPADIARAAALGPPLGVHLKLVKAGGLGPLLAAGRKLQAAGVTVMVGQMNEGSVATAAAAHAALALGARGGELYGADGLLDDPAHGLRYDAGSLHLPEAPGLGVTFDPQGLELLWEQSV